jgi:hypothetical protein
MEAFQWRIYMKCLMQLFLISIIFLVAQPQAISAQNTWQQMIENEAGFTISFPAKPTYEQSNDPTLIHQTEKYKFFYNGHYMQIIFASLNKRLRTPADFSDAFADITRVQAKDGILLRQVKLPDGGRQYDNVTTDVTGTAYHRTRVYIRNERYYALTYSMYAKDGIDEREVTRFFSSFRFVENPLKRQATVRSSRTRKSSIDNTQHKSWYTFNLPDGSFTADFPGKPEYQVYSSTVTGIPKHQYYFHFGENTFIVSYREEPLAATQPQEVMRQTVEGEMENNSQWRGLRHVQMRDGGHYIERQGIVEGMPIYMRTKVYLRGNRLYQVTALTHNLTGPNQADVVRFLSSFRLL